MRFHLTAASQTIPPPCHVFSSRGIGSIRAVPVISAGRSLAELRFPLCVRVYVCARFDDCQPERRLGRHRDGWQGAPCWFISSLSRECWHGGGGGLTCITLSNLAQREHAAAQLWRVFRWRHEFVACTCTSNPPTPLPLAKSYKWLNYECNNWNVRSFSTLLQADLTIQSACARTH